MELVTIVCSHEAALDWVALTPKGEIGRVHVDQTDATVSFLYPKEDAPALRRSLNEALIADDRRVIWFSVQ